ncbi:MAG: pyruvate ferredoxin oxidoreductase [Acidimicrobiia bacterium]|nr:pyruvate ferredoxin oxidoreductase [Acidimicrobiia bacterium]
MGERMLLTGNHAAAHGARLSRVQVISAYPITPQTTIVEELSEMVASGRLQAKFLTVESEHSAMAACVGAAAAGARTYTATSGQGLALMHEMLHWAVGARLPVVLSNVTRAMAPGWSIWSEQTDFLSQRDVGWLMLFAENVQEAQDFVIWLYRVAEQVYLPGMVAMDAFILSHTSEPLIVHDQDRVDAYLPPFRPLYDLDPAEPRAYGGLVNRDHYYEMRFKMYENMERAGPLLAEAGREFGEVLGFPYAPVEPYMIDDADYVLVSAGAMTSNVRFAVRLLRERGIKVGLLRLVAFRPFPFEEVRRYLGGRAKVAVLDRNMSPGHSGIFAQEIRAALSQGAPPTDVYGYVLGIGGRDIRVETVVEAVEDLLARDHPERCLFVGVKGLPIGPVRPDAEVRPLEPLEAEASG